LSIKNNFQAKNGLSVNNIPVIDSNANGTFNNVTATGNGTFNYVTATGNGTFNYVTATGNGKFSSVNVTSNLIVSGTDITNQIQAAFNKANTGGGGGGTSSGNTLVTTPSNTSFIPLGNPTAVTYTPTSYFTQTGQVYTNSANTNSYLATSSNNYVDIASYSGGAIASPYNINTNGIQGFVINRTTGSGSFPGIPANTYNIIQSLTPGSTFNIVFAAGTSSSEFDIFSVNVTVASVGVMDYATIYSATSSYPNQYLDRISYSGGSYWGNYTYFAGTGNAVIWTNNYVVQPVYTASVTSTNTPLLGLRTGHPINYQFLSNVNGVGVLNLNSIVAFTTSSYAASQYVGIISLNFPISGGTIVTLPANTYNQAIAVSNTITVGNNFNSTSATIQNYDLANNKIIISTANQIANITTSTPIQQYNSTEYSPIFQLGKNLVGYEEPNQKRTLLTGNLIKASSVQTVGSVISQSYANNTVVFSTLFAGYYPTSPLIPPNYTNAVYWNINGSGSSNFKIINAANNLYNLISSNGSSFYVTYYNGSGSIANLAFQTINQGTSGTYNYTYGFSTNSPGNFTQLNLTSYTLGVTSQSNTGFYGPSNDTTYTNTLINVPANCVSFVVPQSTINLLANSTSNTITIEGITTPYTLNVSSNTIITQLPIIQYGNTNFVNSAIVQVSSPSQYATFTDVNNLLPSWISKVTTDTNATSTSYALTGGTGGIGLRTFGLDSVLAGGSSTSTYQVAIQPSYTSLALTYNPSNTYWATGGITGYSTYMQEGSWADRLYANTSIVSRSWISGNTVASNTSYSTKLINTPAGYYEADPYIANVAVLLTGTTTSSNAYYNIVNDAPNGGQIIANTRTNSSYSADFTGLPYVPPGAPSWARSVMVGAYDFSSAAYSSAAGVAFSNPNNFNLEDSTKDWTIESWLMTTATQQATWLLSGNFHPGNSSFNSSSTQIGVFSSYYTQAYLNGTNIIYAYSSGTFNQYSNNGYFPARFYWYHFAVTHTASTNTTNFFINGYLTSTSTTTWTTPTAMTAFPVWSAYPTLYYNYRITVGNNRYPIGSTTTGVKYFVPTVMPYGTSNTTANVIVSSANTPTAYIQGAIALQNSPSAPPTSNNTGGALYTVNGVLYYKGPTGTITTLGAA